MKNQTLIYVLLLFCMNIKLFGQDINSPSAVTLPSSGTYTVSSGQIVHITSAVSVTLGPGVTLSAGSMVTIGINNAFPIAAAPSNPANDYDKNWILTRTYDENGNEIGAAKQFFDNNGKPTQAQTKNESAGHILASQAIYDLQGRAVVNTLPAPINNSAFAYKDGFVTNSGNNYSYLNFDGDPTNTSNHYAKLNNPDAVDNGTQGTLGWYYSNNNTFEPYVGATSFPYSRADFYHDGTSATKRMAGIGEQLKMGVGHEATSNSFPVQHELDNYLAIRNQFFTSAVVGSSPSNMGGQALQSLEADQNGTTVLSINDLSGKMNLMTGRADAGGWLSVTNTTGFDNRTPLYSFTANDDAAFPITSFIISSPDTVNITCTGCATPYYRGIGNNFSFSGSPVTYNITSAYPFTVSETLHEIAYANPNITIYDQAEAKYQESESSSIQYFQLAVPSAVSITGNYTLYNMTTEADITSGFTSGGTLPAGYYKAVATAPIYNYDNNDNTVSVSYTNKYSDISYNYYNQLGQLIASIAPNGVQTLIQSGYGGYSSASQLPFVSLYNYDLQGRLSSVTTPDGGTSNFIYRQDGKIRFSQNAAQANAANAGSGNAEKFSYTNYDSFGRPIESGELAVATAGTFAGLATNTTVLEATDVTGGLPTGAKVTQVNTYYDVPASSLPIGGYTQDVGFLKGAVSYTSSAIAGTVNSATYYSYDDHGRVTWMLKQLTGLGAKSVDYTYNDQGNVTKVDYQQGTAGERFIHYYDYDADGRLVNVQTSRDDVNKLQQAKYYYYLHGPLKRTELGDQLQGIDYVYTAQGWLKSMNTPTGDASKDPNQDGVANEFAKDAFGIQLEYFSGDYTRSGSNINSIATGQPTYYNGNVNGLSWQSNKPGSVISSSGSGILNPATYGYSYDSKYQLTGAARGTPNFSTGSFTSSSSFNESGITYDANGNIKGLQRTNGAGTLTDDFSSYQYASGTNKLTSVGNTGTPSAYASYTYDELGQLKSQVSGSNTLNIKYDVTGKITGIYDASNAIKVGYTYDESGNRISRTDYTGSSPITTYYVYDAAGSALAIYTGATLTEMPVYGSDRLGTYTIASNSYVYELRDNVGSVRVVINHTKNTDGTANIIQYNDYYPYGSIAQSGGMGYRYDYQGAYSEKDPITGYNNFELRMYDGKIGRWLSTDPAGQFASPYEGMGNNPVMGSDPTGGYDTWLGAWLASWFGLKGSVEKNTNPNNLNYGQYYYTKPSTTSIELDGTLTVKGYPEHYGNGSQAYQLNQYLGSLANQLQREAAYDKMPGLKTGVVNPYTGKTNGSGAITVVYPLETAILTVGTFGAPEEELVVYRVFGGKSEALGGSWTPIDPRTLANYRNVAGLPSTNTAEFIIEGTVKRSDIILTRGALRIGENQGGLLEHVIDPKNVTIKSINPFNPFH